MKQHQNQNQNRAVNQPVIEVDGLEEGGGTRGHMTTAHFLFGPIRDQNRRSRIRGSEPGDQNQGIRTRIHPEPGDHNRRSRIRRPEPGDQNQDPSRIRRPEPGDQNQNPSRTRTRPEPEPVLSPEQLLPDRTRMWTCLILLSLLDQNQAAPLPGKHGDPVLMVLQQQVAQTAVTAVPSVPHQRTSSSSSSSSSSSESSESSQRPMTFQLLEDRQQLDTMAVEQVESEETSELLPPSTTSQTDGGQDQVMLQASLRPLSSQEVGVSSGPVGGATPPSAGGAASEAEEEEKIHLHPQTDDSLEDGVTFHLPGFHGDEAGLELAL